MLRVIPRIAKESRHILIRPNKREIEPKESGMNQGFRQLHMAMWQSQVDSSNTVCLPLCYFTYLPNRHVFIFLPLQKEDCHCLEEEKKKKKKLKSGTMTEHLQKTSPLPPTSHQGLFILFLNTHKRPGWHFTRDWPSELHLPLSVCARVCACLHSTTCVFTWCCSSA